MDEERIGTLGAVHRSVVGVLLLVAACSTGPAAPPIQSTELVCAEQFCTSVPNGWEVEHGDVYLAFRNNAAPGEAFATLSSINMQAIVENAGGSWPATTEEVVRSFWQLLEDAGVARFERLERLTGGAFRSEGSHENGRLWHLVIPGSGSEGIGFEVRGPNASWETHADAFFGSVEVVGFH